jgi:N6-L-threonylcarbamoyladenine synthase
MAIKCRRALEQTGAGRLVVAGGVGANQALRTRLREVAEAQRATVHYPRLALCTDKGAMVAYLAHCRLAAGQRGDLSFDVTARWGLEELTEPGQPSAA